MQITMTSNEAQVLLNFIDVAVKSLGLVSAEPALHFQKMLVAGINADTGAAKELPTATFSTQK